MKEILQRWYEARGRAFDAGTGNKNCTRLIVTGWVDTERKCGNWSSVVAGVKGGKNDVSHIIYFRAVGYEMNRP